MKWINVADEMPPCDMDDPELMNGIPLLIYMPHLEGSDDYPGHSIMTSNPIFARKQAELGTVTQWAYIDEPNDYTG